MIDDLVILGIAGTVCLWAVSAAGALLGAVGLTAGLLGPDRRVRAASSVIVNITRGIPTSVLVLGAGMLAMHAPAPTHLPAIYPGTDPAFQHVAWALVAALALGSMGHVAEILVAARDSLGPARIEQILVMGLSPLHRLALVARETASVALPALGGRLVHHLHNTAFAALFPVNELFGVVQGQANATFRVFAFVLLGCAIYVCLSACVWLAVRAAEALVRPPRPDDARRPGASDLEAPWAGRRRSTGSAVS